MSDASEWEQDGETTGADGPHGPPGGEVGGPGPLDGKMGPDAAGADDGADRAGLMPDGRLAKGGEVRIGGLRTAQERALLALLSEPSVAAAASKAGVGERTLHNWLRDPRFVEEYRKARRDAFGQAIALTQRSASGAVATLVRIMHDSSATWSARVRAAAHILSFARESIELDDLAARIEALEKAGP